MLGCMAGWSFLLDNSNADLLFSYFSYLSGCQGAEELELNTFYKALLFANDAGLPNIHFLSECLNLCVHYNMHNDGICWEHVSLASVCTELFCNMSANVFLFWRIPK